MLNNVKVAIFDLDGTLVDSSYDLASAVNFTRNIYNLQPLEVSQVASYLGSGIVALVKSVLPTLDDNTLQIAVKQFKQYYNEHLLDKTKPYNKIKDMLEALPNIKKVVLSNKDELFSKIIIKELGLNKYFDNVFGGNSFSKKKPDPLPVLEIIKQYNINKDEIVMIGDGANDILVGKNAGIKTIGVLYGYSTLEQVKKLSPDFIAENPNNIVDIINNNL